MKFIKLISVLLLLAITSNQIFSTDTVSTKFLPLRIGNVWVYSYTGMQNGKIRIKITGTQNSNGHTYYIFQQDGNTCNCEILTYSPFLTQLHPMRIDSINGNLMFYGSSYSCPWQINETILDSIERTRVTTNCGDTIGRNNCNKSLLYDTSEQQIFSQTIKTKQYGACYVIPNYYRRYAKDIGLISSQQNCVYFAEPPCIYTLLGCVVSNVIYGDTSFPVGINKVSSGIPDFYELSQNYPNPFNPKTTIEYKLPADDFVNLSVYDNLGNKVAELVNETQQTGTYKAEFDGTNFASGVYYYKLSASGGTSSFSDSQKMVLIK